MVQVQKITSFVVFKDPKISIIPKFLSPAECASLISIGEEIGFTRSLVGRGVYGLENSSDSFTNQYSENRTSFSVTLPTDTLPTYTPHTPLHTTLHNIEARLCELVQMDIAHLESLVLVKYEPRQKFGLHHDGKFRKFTVFIYLNEPPTEEFVAVETDSDGHLLAKVDTCAATCAETGGETFFSNISLKIKPHTGTAVLWENNISPGIDNPKTVHEGIPPVGWTKYGVNCFFNDQVMRQYA